MIDRENLGVIEANWPTLSVPCPVEDVFWGMVRRLPPEIQVVQIGGKGYHVAGWSYIEVEAHAPSYGRALEEAERLNHLIMWEFQNA